MSNSLISVSQIRGRLNLSDDEGVNMAIASAMTATLPYLQEVLQTGFDASSSEDVFFIDPVVHVTSSGTYVLKLKNGFVKKASVKMAVADTLEGLQTTAKDLLPSFVLDEKGFVRVPDRFIGMYVAVAYDYGFTEDDEAPLWLQEAAISYTIKVLSSQQVGDGKPQLSEIFKFIDAHGSTILSGKLRSMSESIRALN